MGFIHFTTPRNAVTRGFVRKVVKWTFSLFFVLVSTDTEVLVIQGDCEEKVWVSVLNKEVLGN